MSLYKCPDCGGNVSDSASACPKCGRPNTSVTAAATGGGAMVAPVTPAKEWQAGSIASGLLQLGIAAWLQFAFLPAHDPDKVGALQAMARGLQGKDTWVLKPGMYLIVQVLTIAIAANGILRLVVYGRREPRRGR